MKLIITGGTGYVGSPVVHELKKLGHEIVVFDNLVYGHREAIPKSVRLVKGDLTKAKAVAKLFEEFEPDAVLHFASYTYVGESVQKPEKYFRNNVLGALNLLECMKDYKVKRIIFSSSAAVYGQPKTVPIKEDAILSPTSPYGETKLMIEKMLAAFDTAYGIKSICLRYFNAAGASEMFGEDHRPETHLVPNVLNAAVDKKSSVDLYGYDYDTPDGTCVRDYVHVVDIAQAHVLALRKIDKLSGKAYNLGSGHGNSVLEVIEVSRQVTGVDIAVTLRERRAGDPAVLVASCGLAKKELGWRPKFTKIEDIID